MTKTVEAPCNACDALSVFAVTNVAGYCEDCLGECEVALGNRLQSGEITMEEYKAQFDAMHAEL